MKVGTPETQIVIFIDEIDGILGLNFPVKSKQSIGLLTLYQQILERQLANVNNSPIEGELLLSGLVVKKQGSLSVNNRIYASIFDRRWLVGIAYRR